MKKVNVLGETYKIKYVDKIDSMDSWGCFDEYNKLIRIKKDLPRIDIMWTLLHEVFHATLFRARVTPVLDNAVEEIIVDILSRASLDFMQQYNESREKEIHEKRINEKSSSKDNRKIKGRFRKIRR